MERNTRKSVGIVRKCQCNMECRLATPFFSPFSFPFFPLFPFYLFPATNLNVRVTGFDLIFFSNFHFAVHEF